MCGEKSSNSRPSTSMNAVIICAGRSSRFGGKNKALARLGRETVIEQILRHVAPWVNESIVTVSSRHADAMRRTLAGRQRVRIVVDDSFGGPLASAIVGSDTFSHPGGSLVILGEVLYRSDRVIADLAAQVATLDCDIALPVEWQSKPYENIILDERGSPRDVYWSVRSGGPMRDGLALLGHYFLRATAARFIDSVRPHDGERYITDLIATHLREGGRVRLLPVTDAGIHAFNTMDEFRAALELLSESGSGPPQRS